MGVAWRIAGHEASLERAVHGEEVARGGAECDEIARPVEAVDEAVERAGVPIDVELPDEAGRRGPHRRQRPLEPATEEVDAAVREARRQKGDDLPVGRILVAERESDRVPIDASGVVKLAIQPLQRLPEPAHTRQPRRRFARCRKRESVLERPGQPQQHEVGDQKTNEDPHGEHGSQANARLHARC